MVDIANEMDYCARWGRAGALRYVLRMHSGGVFSDSVRDRLVRWVLSDRFGMPSRF